MKHPWQIWLVFVLSLTIVLPGMVWLTLKTLELDQARSEAMLEAQQARGQAEVSRQQAIEAQRLAEEQDLVSNALWRIDTALTPILAQEAARPYFVYEPFVASFGSGKGKVKEEPTPSPILVQPSEFVHLHFQIDPHNVWTSPQSPTGLACDVAIGNQNTTLSNVRASIDRLDQLKQLAQREDLLANTSSMYLPDFEPMYENLNGAWAANTGGSIPLFFEADSGNTIGQQLAANSLPNGNDVDATPQQPGSNDLQNETVDQQTDAQTTGAQQALPQAQAGNALRSSRAVAPVVENQAANELFNNQFAQANQPQSKTQREQLLRGGNDWQRRNRAYQSYAQNNIVQQRVNPDINEVELPTIAEGISRPMWLKDQLLLVRRVRYGDDVFVQGCWLNWPELKKMLLEEVSDLLPGAELEPVYPDSNVEVGRVLATLPVQIVAATPVAAPDFANAASTISSLPTASPLRLSLILAWGCLIMATVAVAALLMGVISLSERRAAFVSAVTHELRTPLTTFRMYTEMLSEGMTSRPEQREQYVETLRVEADRLSHLVENVLSYAQLERGGKGSQRVETTLGDILSRSVDRLSDRATQAGMNLVVEDPARFEKTPLNTDPQAVEQILFNLVDNACKYAVSADDSRIHLSFESRNYEVLLKVSDHGPGISRSEASQLFLPFSKSAQQAATSAPGVGLGLALCRRLASALGGSLTLQSEDVRGACFVLALPITHES